MRRSPPGEGVGSRMRGPPASSATQCGESAPCTSPREWILCSAEPIPMAQRTASSVLSGPPASLAESSSPETGSLVRKSSLVSPTCAAISFRRFSNSRINTPNFNSTNTTDNCNNSLCLLVDGAYAYIAIQSYYPSDLPLQFQFPAARRCACASAQSGIASCLAFCYSVERAPLTPPVAHVQSQVGPISSRNGSGAKC